MSIQFQQLRDECYRKVYLYKCDNHVKCELVLMRRYPLACTRHVCIYLFTGIDKKTFIHFHWVSFFKNNISLQKKLKCHRKIGQATQMKRFKTFGASYPLSIVSIVIHYDIMLIQYA